MKESESAVAGKLKKTYSAEARGNHVDAWRGSGLSMSEYCRHHQLGVSTLSKWVQRSGLSTGLKLKPLKTPAIASPSLPLTAPLEIRLPSGIQIRLAHAGDITTFKNILEVIRSCN